MVANGRNVKLIVFRQILAKYDSLKARMLEYGIYITPENNTNAINKQF